MTIKAHTAFRILADAIERKAHDDLDRALALRQRAQHLEANMPNTMQAIAPYWCAQTQTWVFDDDSVGLRREPFVEGIPEMIDDLVQDIPDARDGFRLIFSETPFPGYQRRLTWVYEELGGNWYRLAKEPDDVAGHLSQQGWLCPALFKYFDRAPQNIYVKAESLV